MASKLGSILGLSLEQEEQLDKTAGKLKSLTEWFNEALEAIKENELFELAGYVGEIAKEWSGTAKALSKVIETVTKEQSPEVIGWLACSLAYREAAESALLIFGRPKSRLPFSRMIYAERLNRLQLEQPETMKGFSLKGATGHPFARAADKAFVAVLDCAGYDDAERRVLLRNVRATFVEQLRFLVAGLKNDKFAAFSRWLELDTDDSHLYATIAEHVDQQRRHLEDQPALRIEPFAINDVYIKVECGILPWGAIYESGQRSANDHGLDPFSEGSSARQDLMSAVISLIEDPKYRDWIVIMGPPGANGPRDYGFNATYSIPNIWPGVSPYVNNAYPSPNGLENEGVGGDF